MKHESETTARGRAAGEAFAVKQAVYRDLDWISFNRDESFDAIGWYNCPFDWENAIGDLALRDDRNFVAGFFEGAMEVFDRVQKQI